MANEVRVNATLFIQKGSLVYRSNPNVYLDDLNTAKSPSPGQVMVTTAGVDVDLGALITPGYCWMQNLDDTNPVEYGIHDGSLFHPFGWLKPGKFAIFDFSPNLGEEHTAGGTGTTGVVNAFHMKAYGATCNVRVDAFEAE